MKTAIDTVKEQRFKAIYAATFDKLNRIFLRSLKSEELTHDILQDAYLKLWSKLDEVDGRQDCMPFLYFHARNYARKEINSRLKREGLEQELSLLNEVTDMETELEKKEYRSIVGLEIDNLPPKRQQVYRMFKEDGLSYKSIAETLNISNKTVDNHLSEAVKTIKKKIYINYGIKTLLVLFSLGYIDLQNLLATI